MLIAFAAMGASTAHGEWKLIAEASPSGPGMSYDAARTQYETPYVTTWTRVVLATPGTLSTGDQYSSALQKVAFDCASQSWAVVHSEFFVRPDVSGPSVYSYTLPRDKWELRAVRRESNAGALMRVVCSTPTAW